MPGQKTKIVNELKSLLDALPAGRRQQAVAALRDVFAEIGAECDGAPLVAQGKACEG